MKNIEKLLDALLKTNGDVIAIKVGEATFIIQNGIKKTVSKKIISQEDLDLLKDECLAVYDDNSVFPYQDALIRFTSGSSFIKFEIAKEDESKEEINNSKIDENEDQDEELYREVVVKTESKEESSNKTHNTENYSHGIVDVKKLMIEMVEKKASDLHLCSGEHPVMRIDGDMILQTQHPKLDSDALLEGLKRVTPEKNILEYIETYDTDFGFEIEGLSRFRGNIFADHRGHGAVFRQIPSKIISAEALNVPKSVINLLGSPKGLILVTGPTGSGKSTTLAAMVDYINSNYRKHIITIEDPVEFVHKNKKSILNQREVSTHTKSFSKALRAALREDPDVILVGEMRDLETTAIAIEMAATGHLVMGTLHTNTAVGTIDRLIDQFPTNEQQQIKMMLSDALIGVVSQMLCKKSGGGRIAAYEILIVNPAVSNLIREGKNFQITSVMETGKKTGNKLMNVSFKELVADGLVEPDEALSRSIDRNELEKELIESGLIKMNGESDHVIKF